MFLTFGDDVLQSVPFVLGWHIASTFSARGQGTPWCYHPHPADQCAALDVAQEIYISFCLRFFRDAWAATYQYAFFSDDDEGFLVIQMAGSGLHRPAVLWMMFTFISCIDNDARANALRQAFGVLLPDDPPVCELLREHLFSTRPFSWLSVVWTCCYGAGLLNAAHVPQCGGLWTLLPLLQSDHR